MNKQQFFKKCTADDSFIYMPEDQVDQSLYLEIKSILTNNLGKWKGGKIQGFQFDYDPTQLLIRLQNGEEVNFKKKFQFFPTPPEVVDKMIQVVLPEADSSILEPSAGQGHIIQAIQEFQSWAEYGFDAIEIHPVNQGILRKKGINVVGDDFLKWTTEKRYDYIFMNPPFKEGSKNVWIDHIKHAVKFLKEKGELVAVAPASASFVSNGEIKEFREEWLPLHNGYIYDIIPKGAFKSSGTGVKSVIIHINYMDREI